MCGISGIFDPNHRIEGLEPRAVAMARVQAFRGPDAEGCWHDAQKGIALSHRRLSIQDLTPAGAQPMVSANGRYVISYNGEIYNAAEIRTQLAGNGTAFRGHSDTEALLEACACWGVRGALERARGMFAFALWDRQSQQLHLARDHVGIKPLYWGMAQGAFFFASQPRAFVAALGRAPEIDRDALAAYLRHNCVPGALCIYKGFGKLLPGHVLSVGRDLAADPKPYWSALNAACTAMQAPVEADETEAADHLEQTLSAAVRRQMVSDVPLGAFLSGGIDSSCVAALMQKQSPQPVRTFSIGFHESGFNEADHAARVAAHLGTDHTELYVSPEDALATVPRLARIYDEPFADSSQLPTYLVSEMTRRHVTVALSGDGGDELFAGYNRYVWTERLWAAFRRMPLAARRALAAVLSAVPEAAYDAPARLLGPRAIPQLGDKVHKLAGLMRLDDPAALYRALISTWDRPEEVVIGGREPTSPFESEVAAAPLPDLTARLQMLDFLCYLPDDILHKVDRASMAVSLEVRVPLLDLDVFECAWRMPRALKLRGGQGKYLLRQVLYRHVPPHLVDRPKMGFGMPIGRWLRGPLREWAEDLLDERRLRDAGLVDPAPVRRIWSEHLSGRRNWQYRLWNILVLEAWREEWASRPPADPAVDALTSSAVQTTAHPPGAAGPSSPREAPGHV